MNCETVFKELKKDFAILLTDAITIKKQADEKSEYKTSAMMDELIEKYTKTLWMLKQTTE